MLGTSVHFFLGGIITWQLVLMPSAFGDSYLKSPNAEGSALALKLPVDALADQQPFWKCKPQIYRKILEDRAVIVAASRTELSDGPIVFDVKGGWLVSTPREFALHTCEDYSRLPVASEYFKSVKWDAGKQELSLTIEALGHREEFLIHILPVTTNDRDELQFEVISGAFTGLRGFAGFEDRGFGKTEMSMDATFKTKNPPLPKAFMTFAMEVITQKVAERMRNYLEAQYSSPTNSPAPQGAKK